MNILHVISSVYKEGGGTSEVVPRLCRAQQEAGHRVVIATVDPDCEVSETARAAFAAGVLHRSWPRWRFPPTVAYSPGFRRGIADLVRAADIVQLHGLWQSPGWIAAAECRRQKKPYVIMTHGFLEPERLKISKWKKRLSGWLFDWRDLKHASALIATSESEAQGLRQYGLTNPIHIMPIGLDLEPFLPPVPHEQKTLLYFSRITPIKGLDLLAEAWARLCRGVGVGVGVEGRCRYGGGWKLLVVGPDDRGYTEEMKKLYAAKCPPGSYEFRGPVFGDEKYKLLASVDAMVLPTRNENWSIAVAEGMAAGLPVVCTKGAPWSCLGENWVDISVEGIEAGLRRVLSASNEERMAIGVANRNWAEEHLSWQSVIKKLELSYKKVVAEFR